MFLAQDKWVSFVKHASPNRRLPWLSNYIFKQQYKPFPKLKGLFKYLLPTYGTFILLASAINNPGSSKLRVVSDLQGKSVPQNGDGGFSILRSSFCHFLRLITKKLRTAEDLFLGSLEKPSTLIFVSWLNVFKCFPHKMGFSCPLSP